MNQSAVVSALDADTYHRGPAIGASGLKRFQISPLHYWAAFLDPDREEVDKRAFRVGRAWHCAVFEPQHFARRYVVSHGVHPATTKAKLLAKLLALTEINAAARVGKLKGVPDDIKPSTNEGKQLYAELEAAGFHPLPESDVDWLVTEVNRMHGKDVLSADDTDRVQRMASLARAMPISRVIFEQMADHVRIEQSMFTVDPATGVKLKIRPDLMLEPCEAFPDGLIVDGKSTTDASPAGFGRSVWNLDYGYQAALYPRVYQAVYSTRRPPAFMWLAQEKDTPHAARYYGASDQLQAHYARKIDAMLPSVARCWETGVWPGYPDSAEVLGMPAWAERQMEDAA